MGDTIGVIARLQVQAIPVKRNRIGYDPGPILEVERAAIGPSGMVGWRGNAWVIDAHHEAHPASRGGGSRALSVGFTGHYRAMADHFGSAPVGIAGENIIIDSPGLRLGGLGVGLVIGSAAGNVELRSPRVAAPCVEFTCFLRNDEELLPREDVADDMAFLDHGTRGYILDVSHLDHPVVLAVGDEVSLIG